jgi:NADH dehydrogenase
MAEESRSGASARPRPRVVIVGGGFAGLEAAKALAGAEAELLLFDRHNHHLFQPLLYQVATAALSPGDVAAPIRSILRGQRNCRVVMAEVTDVELASSTVGVAGVARWVYDYLVLAPGAVTHYFSHPEWAAAAPGLKTVDEALDIRSRMLLSFEQAEIETDLEARRRGLTFAIVGAGPTGVEMAGALIEIARQTLRHDFRAIDTREVRVVLIDALDRVLPTFHPWSSGRARRDLERMGVELMLGTRVTRVDRQGLDVERPQGTERIDADNVIWAAGVRAHPLGARLGVETDRAGRVVVGDDLTVRGAPNVFVAGDLALRIDPRSGQPVPGVAQGAIQMGRFAGRTIAAELRELARRRRPPPRGVFVYDDLGSMATIGRYKAIAEIRGWRFGGLLAFLVWGLIHVTALIGFRRRLIVLAQWTWLYFFYTRGVRLITGDRRLPRPLVPPPDPRLTGEGGAERAAGERAE